MVYFVIIKRLFKDSRFPFYKFKYNFCLNVGRKEMTHYTSCVYVFASFTVVTLYILYKKDTKLQKRFEIEAETRETQPMDNKGT